MSKQEPKDSGGDVSDRGYIDINPEALALGYIEVDNYVGNLARSCDLHTLSARDGLGAAVPAWFYWLLARNDSSRSSSPVRQRDLIEKARSIRSDKREQLLLVIEAMLVFGRDSALPWGNAYERLKKDLLEDPE